MKRRVLSDLLSRAELIKLQQSMTDKEIAAKFGFKSKAMCALRKKYELNHPNKHINLRELNLRG